MAKKIFRRGERRYVYRSCLKRWAAACFDAVGHFFVKLMTFGQGLEPNSDALARPRSILVVRLDHLGDVLFARPCLQALKARFPQASLSVLASRAACELVASDPFVDNVIPWDAPWFARANLPPGQPTFWGMVRRLHRRRFDLALELRGDLRNHLLLWLSGVRMRVGYGITGGDFLLHQTRHLAVGLHEVKRNLQLAALVDALPVSDRYAPLALSTAELKYGQSQWQTFAKRVVFHPMAGNPEKCWPTHRLIEIADGLIRAGCELLVVGGADEFFSADMLANACLEKPKVLAGKTHLRELAALIASAHLLVGSDSGPAHLAMTQGVPTIFLWSRTNDPEEWGPWGKSAPSMVACNPEQEHTISDILTAAKHLMAAGVSWRKGGGGEN